MRTIFIAYTLNFLTKTTKPNFTSYIISCE